TLLKLISRITAPTEGQIGLNGRVASMLEVGTGFHGELTGRENIYMNGAILGMKKREIDAKMEDIIDFSECRQFIDTPVKRYSSGMYVKLAFAVASHLDSEILIMDEVLAVGDMAFQRKCLDKMNDVSQSQGRTILYVSHNMNTVRSLCSRCIVLDQGKLTYDGETEEAIQRYLDMGRAAFGRVTDYTAASHMPRVSRKAQFVRAEVCRDNNLYTSDEAMEVIFTVESGADYDDIRFMMILFSLDGTRLGKTESENFTLKEGRQEIPVSVPLEGLADGQYYFQISILQRSRAFGGERLDGIPDALPFVIGNREAFGIPGARWNSQFWGHFMMKPIRLVQDFGHGK
ncbi:MAG: ATP-binding cassette domain-containing protein, partial [Lachnospiraceae bacterium]|nr:ATP-binding cassette domain-containing protein [Lachnospiraceae bacterium]